MPVFWFPSAITQSRYAISYLSERAGIGPPAVTTHAHMQWLAGQSAALLQRHAAALTMAGSLSH